MTLCMGQISPFFFSQRDYYVPKIYSDIPKLTMNNGAH
jgi:hypothetical protein